MNVHVIRSLYLLHFCNFFGVNASLAEDLSKAGGSEKRKCEMGFSLHFSFLFIFCALLEVIWAFEPVFILFYLFILLLVAKFLPCEK